MNSFADEHPEQVLVNKLFPITPRKMLKYSLLQLFIFQREKRQFYQYLIILLGLLTQVLIVDLVQIFLLFSSKKTKNNETYLGINTHQPLEGPTSWYEAHLISEEGTNIIGATFPGAPCILTGTNQNLGWTHTVNYPDKTDIFQLQMVKNSRLKYLVDNEILTLEKYRGKAFIKILGIPIKVSKKDTTEVFMVLP